MDNTKLTAQDRIVDLAFFGHALVAVGWGLTSEGWAPRSSMFVTYAQVALISFIGVLYPFRVHTRLLWNALMPIASGMAVTLGFHCHIQLTHAPGYASGGGYLLSMLPITLLIYFVSLPLWISLRLFGWQLTRDAEGSPNRTLGLNELFALIGILCFLLVLLRDLITMEELMQILPSSRRFLAYLPFALWYCALTAPCLLFGFHSRLRSAVVGCTGWLLLFCVVSQRFYVFQPMSRPAFLIRFVEEYLLGILLVLATCAIARWCGYRLTRTSSPPLA